MTKTVATIILAAGASTRMGTPKQLLPYRGTTLLRHVVEQAIASVCQPIIVVLGANAEKIYPSLNQLPIQIVENLNWNQGIGTSIKTGIESLSHLHEKIEAIILTLGDQPFISTQIINRLVEAYHTTGQPIIASEYAETCGVPALFDRTIFAELITLKQTEGAKKIIKKHHHQTFSLPFPQGAIDIDTPQDYQQLQTKIPWGDGAST
ncbi:MAG TPA: 4-diphosphocytidyl-2C-methyl-D-erythritol synthase [Cyanobacteria bacterium UBA11372]|nr:4-diphosphocytidyl-2C-methyl-D-erythritol synthase [Cyanobacteria bacterium UBA11372]